MDLTQLTQWALETQRQTIPNLQRGIRDLVRAVETHRLRLVRLENHGDRRMVVEVTNLPVNTPTDVPIVWDTPLPAQDYTPLVTILGGDNAITVVRVGLKPLTKDENGCVLRIVNTGVVTIASVFLDVAAVRP